MPLYVPEAVYILIYVYIIPIVAGLSVALHAFFYWWTPKPAKIISRSRWSKGGSFFADFDDAGILRFRYGSPIGLEGTHKIGKDLYQFTPTALPIESGTMYEYIQGEDVRKRLTPEHFNVWNKAVTSRAIFEGTNKAIYFGVASKGISLTPASLSVMYDSLVDMTEKRMTEKQADDAGLISIDDYLMGKTSNQSTEKHKEGNNHENPGNPSDHSNPVSSETPEEKNTVIEVDVVRRPQSRPVPRKIGYFTTIPFDILKYFLDTDFGPQRIMSIGERFFLKGKFGKYKEGQDWLMWLVILIVILAAVGGILLFMGGGIKIPGLG